MSRTPDGVESTAAGNQLGGDQDDLRGGDRLDLAEESLFGVPPTSPVGSSVYLSRRLCRWSVRTAPGEVAPAASTIPAFLATSPRTKSRLLAQCRSHGPTTASRNCPRSHPSARPHGEHAVYLDDLLSRYPSIASGATVRSCRLISATSGLTREVGHARPAGLAITATQCLEAKAESRLADLVLLIWSIYQEAVML